MKVICQNNCLWNKLYVDTASGTSFKLAGIVSRRVQCFCAWSCKVYSSLFCFNVLQTFIDFFDVLEIINLQVQTLKSQDAMAQAMKGVTRAMQNMNRQLNLPQIQKIMMEFEKQTEIMDMKEEMMGEAVDDAIADEGDEEETETIVAQV